MAVLDDIRPERFPRHIAVIMDGNGRWAVRRKPSTCVQGHAEGAKTVRAIVTECAVSASSGQPEVLTLYSFSLENWKRPPEEVSFLMAKMYIDYLRQERVTMMENDIRFARSGG